MMVITIKAKMVTFGIILLTTTPTVAILEAIMDKEAQEIMATQIRAVQATTQMARVTKLRQKGRN